MGIQAFSNDDHDVTFAIMIVHVILITTVIIFWPLQCIGGQICSWHWLQLEVKQKFSQPCSALPHLFFFLPKGQLVNIQMSNLNFKCQILIRKWNVQSAILSDDPPTASINSSSLSLLPPKGYQKFCDHNSLSGHKLFDKVFFNFWP